MSSELFIGHGCGGGLGWCAPMRSDDAPSWSSHWFRQAAAVEPVWIFEKLPKASIVSVFRPDASDSTPFSSPTPSSSITSSYFWIGGRNEAVVLIKT